jgi:hypothetical protein
MAAAMLERKSVKFSDTGFWHSVTRFLVTSTGGRHDHATLVDL